ncbi:hypothetical protein GCM10011594_32680 [Nakamurella endophytica]|uniref:Uncharacterized protein n=1 Tax=Nakamurella endophytica TaxID=1748367 RepID=A0A917T5S1_9ACTN|nr:hypothetical protein GCM10011594_32680 [Nakamurella endophytica]
MATSSPPAAASPPTSATNTWPHTPPTKPQAAAGTTRCSPSAAAPAHTPAYGSATEPDHTVTRQAARTVLPPAAAPSEPPISRQRLPAQMSTNSSPAWTNHAPL